MGIDFDYEFHVHRRDSGRFLAAVAELCDPQGTRWTNVLLPDGGSVRLPGTHGFVSGKTVAITDGARESFDLSLCFPVDEPLRAYQDEMDLDRGGRVVVGYIYLTISDTHALLPDHLRFGLMPATNSQSRLFLISSSVRETFATLALSTGASLCLLDSELGGPQIIVTALGQRVSTRVPGPCLLWNARGHTEEAFEELSSLLAGQPLDQAKRIIGPQHPQFPAIVESITEYARVPQHVWIGP